MKVNNYSEENRLKLLKCKEDSIGAVKAAEILGLSFPTTKKLLKHFNMSLPNVKTKKCIVCNKDFTKKYACGRENPPEVCSLDCYRIYSNNVSQNKDYPNGFIECKICQYKVEFDLTSHLVRTHNITPEEYNKNYHCEVLSEYEKERRSNNVTGEKNPGYQHSGRFSAFSDNFIHKDTKPDAKEMAQQKSKETKTANPQNENTKIEYYTSKGYSIEDAKKLLSERQSTFSKEICIQKYGEEEGLKVWEIRQAKWLDTLASKSFDEIKEINSKKKPNIGRVSNDENEIIKEIEKRLNIALETQLGLLVDDTYYNFYYDMAFKNKIIEYNGDYWHGNPLKYSADSIISNGRQKFTARKIWEKDALKKKIAEDNGYKLLTIWEHDYKNNKEKAIQDCIKFLTED